MDKIVETVATYLELIVLGAVGIIFIAYLLAIFHPFRQTTSDYFVRVARLWLPIASKQQTTVLPPLPPSKGQSDDGGDSAETERKMTRVLKIGIQLGVIFYAGVLANAAAYWVLSPAHANIISKVKLKATSLQDPRTGVPLVEDVGYKFLLLPLTRDEQPDEERIHEDALYRDVAWRNANPDAAGRILDPLNKFIRLLRGTVLFAMCFCCVALFKTIGASCFAIALCLIPKHLRPHTIPRIRVRRHSRIASCCIWVYENFLDAKRWANQRKRKAEKFDRLRKDQRFEDDFNRMRTFTCRSVVWPNLCICVVAFFIYVLAMFSWRTAEIEYHSMVLAGQATAVKADPDSKKTTDPAKKTGP